MARCEKTEGPMMAPASPDRHKKVIVTTSARPPRRAIRDASAPAMPTTTNDTTSGMTVMRIALTKSVPIGSTNATMRSAILASARLRSRPKTSPAVSARRTRVLSDGRDTRQKLRLGVRRARQR